MSPLGINIMLHYYCCCDDWQCLTEAHTELVVGFQRQGLLTEQWRTADEKDMPKYRISARGTAYVKFLCAMPLPEIRWYVPT